MKRDICVFYKKDVPRVYQAYVEAINQRFGKDCSGQPYHTINFGLSFSFKYNMNGGACTVRLMPYKDGTAVNLRYSIAQAMGARYEKHSDDLNNYVSNILGYAPLRVDIPVEEFLRSERRITPNSRPATPPTPAYTAPAYAAPAAPAYTAPAAPAASPAPQAAPVDYAAVAKTLGEFKSLMDAGILSTEEFARIKEKLLADLMAGRASNVQAAPSAPEAEDTIICPVCNRSQKRTRKLCFQCGAPLR